MQPPICFFCNRDFAPADGQLMHFLPSDRGIAWEQRAGDKPAMTGHHPDTGWFCGAHVEAAEQLTSSHTITDALSALRQETN